MHSQTIEEKRLVEEYSQIKASLLDWGNYIDSYLKSIIEDHSLEYGVQILPKCRLKEDNSLIRKAFYRSKKRSNDSTVLKSIRDKIATRLVFTHLDYVANFRTIFEEKITEIAIFEISRDLNKTFEQPKAFDYNSLHYILVPKQNILNFSSFSKEQLQNFSCELQVRTLLQHAYAEVAHDTIYKGPFGGSKELVRLMSRSMALMESADLYFIDSIELMTKATTYEVSYMNKLIEIAEDKLNLDYQFNKTDQKLTFEIFNLIDIKKFSIEDIERTLVNNRNEISYSLNNKENYLTRQPVIILLVHLIYTNPSSISNLWESLQIDINIIEEIALSLGFSCL